MYQFRQIFKLDLLNLVTNPMWIFFTVGYPLLLTLILGFLTSGGYGKEVTSYDYYGVTIILFIVFNTATLSANSFMEERIKKPNMRIIYSPVPTSEISLSKLLATFVFASVCHLLTGFILHFAAGVNFGGAGSLSVALILLLAELFSSALGVMMCCIMKSESATNQILSLLITLLSILGGLFFPLDGLGAVVQKITNISPIKWVKASVFQIIYDGNFHLFLPVTAILAALSAACVLLSYKTFKTEDYV
jgi:ABC-2 type transport system permease protein